mmetsp:Transcript_26695/g.45691  ORF Transcript_26695/g.45691 Transcript_26695/m.45691 type:complete len:356 (-) Transcript_26695:211-1278(-)
MRRPLGSSRHALSHRVAHHLPHDLGGHGLRLCDRDANVGDDRTLDCVAAVLLVERHLVHQRIELEATRHVHRQVVRREALRYPLDLRAIKLRLDAQPHHHLRLRDAADGDALTVHVGGRLESLDRVADGVPPVESGADARLPLVERNHLGLAAYRVVHDLLNQLGVEGHHALRVRLEQVEERRDADHAHLDRLRDAFHKLPRRERPQQIHVGVHDNGLVEGANQVLPCRHVDRRLAANARIDHRCRRRRDLHHGHTSHERGRHVAYKIADDTSAERNHDRVTVAAVLQHEVFDRRLRLAALAPLTCGHLIRQKQFAIIGGLDRRSMEFRGGRMLHGEAEGQKGPDQLLAVQRPHI